MRVTVACDYNHTYSHKGVGIVKEEQLHSALQLEDRPHRPWIVEQTQPKSSLLEKRLHGGVVAQHLCKYPVQFLSVCDLDQTPQQLASQAAALVFIRNQNGNFRFVLGQKFIESSHRYYVLFARRFICVSRDEHRLALGIGKADSY